MPSRPPTGQPTLADPAHGTMREGLKVLWRGIRDERRIFTFAVLASSVFGAGTAATGWAVGHVTDEVLAPAFATGSVADVGLGGAVALLVAITLTTSVAVAFRRIFAGIVSTNLMARYRRRVGGQFLRLPLAWHHRHPAGQLLSNASSDVEASFMIFNPLPFAIGVVVMIVVAGWVMVLADPVLAVVGLTVIPVLVAANVVYQRIMSPKVVRAQQLRAEVAAVAHESFDGALVVKAMGREADETARFAEATDRLRAAAVDVGRTRGVFDPLVESLPTLGTLAVLGIGTARVASGAAEAGDVVQVAYLLTLLAFPVRAFGWVLGDLPRCAVGFGRVRSVLEATGEMRHGAVSPGREGPAGLELSGVDYSYSYGGSADLAAGADDAGLRELPVLHDVDLRVAPGSTVAVVGPTGSGKSTLTSLMVRLVDPGGGIVRLDGDDVRDLRAGGVAAVASLVPQSTFVFDDTVRGNVTLGLGPADGVTDDVVRDALRLAQADRFVDALPEGLETRVGERGASLSGGQRQRLALARAVVRQPRLLVLDDATSAVDPRVEQDILVGLRDAVAGLTVVVVAYRKATISLADEVVYVEHGRVVARGRHEDLLETQPRYRHLVNAYEEEAALR